MSGYGNSQEDLLNSSLITNTGSSSLSTVVVDENTKKLTEVMNNGSNVTDGDSTETAYDTTSQNFEEEEVEKENQFENDSFKLALSSTDVDKTANPTLDAINIKTTGVTNYNENAIKETMTETIEIVEKSESTELSQTGNEVKVPPAASDTTNKCICKGCENDEKKFLLKCTSCHKSTYYCCTRLPAYQLYLFTRKGYRHYRCDKCIADRIPEEIFVRSTDNKLTNVEESVMQEKFNSFQEKVEQLEYDLLVTKKQLDGCMDEKEKVTNGNRLLRQRLATLDTVKKENMQNLHRVNNLESHQETLQMQIMGLKKTVAQKEEDIKAIKSKPIEVNTLESSAVQTEDIVGVSNLVIDEKLNEFSLTMVNTISKVVDEKLLQLENKFKTIIEIPTEEINHNYKSFAEALKENLPGKPRETMKSVIDEVRNDQLIQDAERKERSSNLIIHGIAEGCHLDEKKQEKSR